MCRTYFIFGLVLFFACQSFGEEKAKIVFLSGSPSHGRMYHEHRAGNIILAEALERPGLAVEPYVVPHYGYPKDKKILEEAATVVIFCTGHSGHLLRPHLDEFDVLMKKGTGVVMIHWATEAEKGAMGEKFLEWMGGFCDLDWSVNPHWMGNFKDFPKHPICNGVKPFSVHDEWYYHMRFVDDTNGLTPILFDLPPAETLRRKDGPRSGNPAVRRAVAEGKKQAVAWAYQRPDGGRGFGFTGAHNHDSWRNDGFRKIVLNAILWTANVDVPQEGCPSAPVSKKDLEENLDPVKTGKQKVTAKQVIAPMDKNGDGEISKDEASEDFKSYFDKIDTNGDRVVDLKEAQVIADYLNNQQTTKPTKVTPAPAEVEKQSLSLLVSTLAKVDNSRVQASLLEGMLTGLAGRRDVVPPRAWTRVATKLASSSDADVRELSSELSQIFGDEEATARALETVQDQSVTASKRRARCIRY